MDFVVGLWSVSTPRSRFTKVEIDQRITALRDAVGRFAQTVNTVQFPHSQTLRGIFVAPEYFLAHLNARGLTEDGERIERTLTVEERNACVELIRQISQQHPHILIIPGTIAWKKTFARHDMGPDRRQRALRHMQYYLNLDFHNALGGEKSVARSLDDGPIYYRPGSRTRWQMVEGMRDTRDTIDRKDYDTQAGIPYYMRNTAYAFHDGDVVYKYHKRGDYFESVNTSETVFIPSSKSPVVTLDVSATQRMDFGFEICLDHNIGMLKMVSGEHALNPPHFHIISSAAVQNVPTHMYMRERGYVLHASSNGDYTGVFENRKGDKVQVQADTEMVCGGYSLETWTVAVPLTPFLIKVKDALEAYDANRSFFGASKASKNALTKLQQLLARDDEAGLRAHLDWYLGKPHAQQPQGAGDRIPTGKKFFTLLNPIA